MIQPLCIDCFLHNAEENAGYARRAFEHALILGARHSEWTLKRLQPTLFYTPRYVFIIPMKEDATGEIVPRAVVSEMLADWYSAGMQKIKVTAFLDRRSLEADNG